MGKISKRKPLSHSNHDDGRSAFRNKVVRRQHSQHTARATKPKHSRNDHPSKSNQRNSSNLQQPRLKVPFTEWDQVLLIGEGDFSFSLSLLQNHPCSKIVATCFDSPEALTHKYPTVQNTIAALLACSNEVEGFGRQQSLVQSSNSNRTDIEWEGFSPEVDSGRFEDHAKEAAQNQHSTKSVILHGIDATKLSTVHHKSLKRHAPFTKIVFNFPHVGGLSTDVNRQVRSNQQLLVDFFKSARPLLATPSRPARSFSDDDEDHVLYDEEYGSDLEKRRNESLKHGQILVTLFEGEPYTLWNIRDLARHTGLRVLESFRFPWSAYPGYQHARTIGDITVGTDRSDEGKRKGAWRGEERDARCYVLALQDDDNGRPSPGSRKRRAAEDDSD